MRDCEIIYLLLVAFKGLCEYVPMESRKHLFSFIFKSYSRGFVNKYLINQGIFFSSHSMCCVVPNRLRYNVSVIFNGVREMISIEKSPRRNLFGSLSPTQGRPCL